MRALHVVVSLLVLTAGCGGSLGGEDDASTVAPRLAGTPDKGTTTGTANTSFPPGVTPGSADPVDERGLYLAHERTLDGRSVTWRHQRLWTNATGSVVAWRTSTSWRDGAAQRYASATGGTDQALAGGTPTEFDYWTDGDEFRTRQRLADGTVRRTASDGGPPSRIANIGAGRTTLESVLTGVDLRYVGVDRGGAGDDDTDGDANSDDDAVHVLAATPDDGRLTLRVTSAGVVRSFVLRTQVAVDGEPLTVVRRFRTYDVGSTTVERPAWTRNETD